MSNQGRNTILKSSSSENSTLSYTRPWEIPTDCVQMRSGVHTPSRLEKGSVNTPEKADGHSIFPFPELTPSLGKS